MIGKSHEENLDNVYVETYRRIKIYKYKEYSSGGLSEDWGDSWNIVYNAKIGKTKFYQEHDANSYNIYDHSNFFKEDDNKPGLRYIKRDIDAYKLNRGNKL